MKRRGRPPLPPEQRANRNPHRIAVYPRTKKVIKANAKTEGKTMMDYLDNKFKDTK